MGNLIFCSVLLHCNKKELLELITYSAIAEINSVESIPLSGTAKMQDNNNNKKSKTKEITKKTKHALVKLKSMHFAIFVRNSLKTS